MKKQIVLGFVVPLVIGAVALSALWLIWLAIWQALVVIAGLAVAWGLGCYLLLLYREVYPNAPLSKAYDEAGVEVKLRVSSQE